MNEQSPNLQQEEEKWTLSNYVVCVTDVLGQKEAIRLLPSILTSEHTLESLDAELKKSLGKRYQSNQQTETAAKETFVMPSPEDIKTLPLEHQTVAKEIHSNFKYFIYRFSDMTVTYAKIDQNAPQASLLAICALMQAMSANLLVCLATKLPLRGGIDGGFAMTLSTKETNEIYGPAFLSAYEIESELSEYPRIVIGKNIKTIVDSLSQNIDAITKTLRSAFYSMIIEDRDGREIINLKSEMLIQNMANHAQYVKDALEFAKTQAAYFRKCSNSKLALRYERLVDTLSRHVK